jgi:hypothetical protein
MNSDAMAWETRSATHHTGVQHPLRYAEVLDARLLHGDRGHHGGGEREEHGHRAV